MSWNPGFSASCTYPTIPTLMFEAAEPTSQPFNTDLPERAPSAARLAAEAFFAPAPGSSSETAEPAVLVKKSKLEEPSPAVSGEMPEPAEPPREPRVFRLSAPAAAADQATAEAPVTLGTVEPVAAVTESQSSEKLLPAPRAVIRRRKRRALHGEVTITRPAAPEPTVAAAPVAEAVGAPEELRAALPAPAPRHQRAAPGKTASVETASHEWPRYLEMRRQLLALQAEARAARAREAQEALVWIKRAIAEYGLTAADFRAVLRA